LTGVGNRHLRQRASIGHPDRGLRKIGTPLARPPLLELIDIRKSFGAIEALRGVSFSVAEGEVVALLGDNGAGKSTLVKIIAGELPLGSGRIVYDGMERHFASPADAKAAGIETVYQDLALCTNVDVVANFFMGRELTRSILGIPFLKEQAMEAETRRALEAGGTRVPSLRVAVEHLSGGQRQAIELNRFVHWGGKLVMLDEPFAALGVEQTRRGLVTVDAVRRRGVGVIIITHVVAQAFAVADRIVVLSHGRVAGDLKTEETSPDEVVRLITGGIERIGRGLEQPTQGGLT
jgi:D-xylose transport system ATP-binding protein